MDPTTALLTSILLTKEMHGMEEVYSASTTVSYANSYLRIFAHAGAIGSNIVLFENRPQRRQSSPSNPRNANPSRLLRTM
jgi:hypothetical protein